MTTPDSDAQTKGIFNLPQHAIDDADVVVVPLPFEGTVSYGGGTANGPAAVLTASGQVELSDDEVNVDLDSLRFHTSNEVQPVLSETVTEYLDRVEAAASRCGQAFAIGIGGEHSLTLPLVRAAHGNSDLSEVTIVQIDAHTDLRHEYEGTIHSHACAMRRLTDAGADLIGIGIRASCREELEYAASHQNISIYRAQSLASESDLWARLLDQIRGITGDVYLTVDLDGLCPSLCPGTGTPEPGGLDWWSTLRLLRTLVCEAGGARLIGCDFVETTPMPNTQVNEFTTARLIGKLIAYRIASQG